MSGLGWVGGTLVAAGGGLGATTRYVVDRAIQRRLDTPFPLGTFAVNVAGCLLLGVLTGVLGPIDGLVGRFLVGGVCGALTTYSTYAFEVWRLAGTRRALLAASYAIGSVLAGLATFALGSVLTG